MKKFLYNPDIHIPVLRNSICTGERSLSLRERASGRNLELGLVRDEKELTRMLKEYGIPAGHLKKEY